MNEADSHPFQKALSQYVHLSITILISVNISTQTLNLLSSRIKKHHCQYIFSKYVLILLRFVFLVMSAKGMEQEGCNFVCLSHTHGHKNRN